MGRVLVAPLITLAVAGPCWGQRATLRAPKAIGAYLDRNYSGWGIPEIAPEWKQYFASRKDGSVPHLVKGDFDGNGKTDHAVLIIHGTVSNSAGAVNGKRSCVIVFLTSRRGYRPVVIFDDVYSPEVYLDRARKGQEDYNIETQRKFTYATDAVVVINAEKTAKSYVYRKGRFRPITTGD